MIVNREVLHQIGWACFELTWIRQERWSRALRSRTRCWNLRERGRRKHGVDETNDTGPKPQGNSRLAETVILSLRIGVNFPQLLALGSEPCDVSLPTCTPVSPLDEFFFSFIPSPPNSSLDPNKETPHISFFRYILKWSHVHEPEWSPDANCGKIVYVCRRVERWANSLLHHLHAT